MAKIPTDEELFKRWSDNGNTIPFDENKSIKENFEEWKYEKGKHSVEDYNYGSDGTSDDYYNKN